MVVVAVFSLSMCCRELWTNVADVTNLGYIVILDFIKNCRKCS